MARAKTSVTVDEALLAEARAMGVNLSQAAQEGIAARVTDEKRRRLKEELRPTVEALNEYHRTHGLPLARIRSFLPEEE